MLISSTHQQEYVQEEKEGGNSEEGRGTGCLMLTKGKLIQQINGCGLMTEGLPGGQATGRRIASEGVIRGAQHEEYPRRNSRCVRFRKLTPVNNRNERTNARGLCHVRGERVTGKSLKEKVK